MEIVLAFLGGAILSSLLGIMLFKYLGRIQEDRFKVISQDILNQSSEKFFTPFSQRIDDYKSFVQDIQNLDIQERTSIKEKISHLMESAKKIEIETNQLTQALSSDVKFQGAWGEIILERVLELSGLEKGKEFEVQNNFKIEGKNYRPDVIIKIPNQNHIVIDSKVSLK